MNSSADKNASMAHSKPFMQQPSNNPTPDMGYNMGAAKIAKRAEKMKNKQWKHKFSIPYVKALWAARGATSAVFGAVGLTGVMISLPFIFQSWNEILGFDLAFLDPTRALPQHTPLWWLNEWRKSQTPWRASEAWNDHSRFYVRPCEYIKRMTGRDMLAFPFEQLEAHEKKAEELAAKNGKAGGNKAAAEQALLPPRVLVPMCGDSPIIKILARAGYEVDAIDSTDTAIRNVVEHLEVQFAAEPVIMSRVHLHLQDIFSPHAWKDETGIPDAVGSFDFIWDRQGISAIDPPRRDDYAFLLKRALKQDGILYTEGNYRTAKRKGNRAMGPPFHFGETELQELFPRTQGFRVKCDELSELTLDDLDSESRITGIIPDTLLARQFPCVVWRDKKMMAEMAHAG